MSTPVLGSDSAETDQLLFSCSVPNWQAYQKPILTGRWGTGKTAAILLANRKLAEALTNVGQNLGRMWFLDERTFDPLYLQKLRREFASDERLLIRVLESLWYGEILVTACKLLKELHPAYEFPKGDHWEHIVQVAKRSALLRSVWVAMPDLAKAILGSSDGRPEAMEVLKHHVDSATQNRTMSNLQKCFRDIETMEPRPVIAIEPIETPGSVLEQEASLATSLVTSLLNVFWFRFPPSRDQQILIRISVPWHRYGDAKVDYPQRLYEHVASIKWTEEQLLTFINLRIEYELKRVFGRDQIKDRSAWQVLFDDEIINNYCQPPVAEDSFRYLLRHTHHRARDVLRLSRKAIEHYANTKNTSVDDILLGKFGKVSGSALREAIRSEGNSLTEELVAEAKRRYPELTQVLKYLKAKPMPFSMDDLKKWVIGSGVGFSRIPEILWHSGFVGVEINPCSADEYDEVRETIGGAASRQYRTHQAPGSLPRWYLFHYSWDGEINTLLERFPNSSRLIIHAKAFEYLRPKTERDHPYGV